MGVPGVLQVRLYAPRTTDASSGPGSWTLSAWIVPKMLGPPDPAVLHSRIATALGIQQGDKVVYQLIDTGETFKVSVSVKDDTNADFVIHGLGDCTPMEVNNDTGETRMTLKCGREVTLRNQELWATLKLVCMVGEGTLYFDGASRNNPNGPAGFGFTVSSVKHGHLVNGYCYCGSATNNEMEYAGLLDGLRWALRFDFEKLTVRGDSELVIRQVTGEYRVNESRLAEYHKKIESLLEKAREQETEVVFEHVPREANVISDTLANLAIDLKENATACNWTNINKQCSRHDIHDELVD